VVITGLTRNQFVGQPAREFESHRLRHEPVCGQCPHQALPFLLFSTPSYEGVFISFVEILHTLTPCYIRPCRILGEEVCTNLLIFFKSSRFVHWVSVKHSVHYKPRFNLCMEIQMGVNIRRSRGGKYNQGNPGSRSV
jgi:hypothetical protein